MNYIKLLKIALTLSLAVPVVAYAQSDAVPSSKIKLNEKIPLDPNVRTGKLANGFTYFIRHNTEPKNRVTLYLANKVGSVLEDEDQRGLAHFMEHMNFNGTKNFPKNDLINYLQKSGIRFGADLNAYTSFDQTVYQLPLPSDNPELLKNGIQIMRDWAQDALLDSVEIDKERGVVLEEKRLGKGSGERLQRQYFPLVFNNSRYSNRLPIGTDTVLNNFKPEAIRRFHHDWYRPDLQALIVVGDIDVNQMEETIKQKFSDLKNPADEKVRTKYNVPLTGKNQFIELTDKELTATQAEVIIKHPGTKTKTFADYRNTIIWQLFNMMLEDRYSEINRRADPPFLRGKAFISGFLGDLNTFDASVIAKPGELEKGFKATWREIERVKRFGFTQTELERAKKQYENNIETVYKEKDKTNSGQYVNQYLAYFLSENAAAGIEVINKLAKQETPAISLSEVNNLTRTYITETNRDILIFAPDKDKGGLPNQAAVLGWMKAVQQEKLEPYTDDISSKPLLVSQPVPGKIVSEDNDKKLNITTYKLSNGVKVLVKPTDFKNDEIIFLAFSPGGTSLYPDADFQSAENASNVIVAGGVGNYNATQLEKFLSGKQSGVGAYISERSQGISGSTDIKNLETAMQLIYARVTEPRKDSVIFRGMIERSKSSLINRSNSPEVVFHDTSTMVLGNYNYRTTPPSLEKLEQINLDKAYEIYKERFADASGLTFIFVGNIDTNVLKPMLEKYLAALPSTYKNEQAKDLGIHPPDGKITKIVYKGSEPKATVRLIFSGKINYSPQNSMRLTALKEVLQIRLLERLREDESGVYSPSVSSNTVKYPQERYTFNVSFGCSPQNVDKLVASTMDEISRLKSDGPPQVNIDKFKAEDKNSREVAIKNNHFWLYYISEQLKDNQDINELNNYSDEINKINPENIKQTARQVLSGNNLIKLVLLPENLNK